MFRKFASWVVPILKRHALPMLKNSAKAIGTEAFDTVADVAKEVISGRNLKSSFSERFNTAVDSLKEKAENTLEGKGIKRQKKNENKSKGKQNKIKRVKFNINRNKKYKDFVILKKKKLRKTDIFD